MTTPFKLHYWHFYTKKLKQKILSPSYMGVIAKEDVLSEEMRLVVGQEGDIKDGYFIRFYVLIDESDGVIADIKYQLFGDSALLGSAEILSELAIRKNYDQARRVSADLIEKEIKEQTATFPHQIYFLMNMAISALDNALEQCEDIPFAETYVPPSPFSHGGEQEHRYPNFGELSEEQKHIIIHEIIDQEIRPYIELDAGGVTIAKIEAFSITISYQGSCTSCYSATGTTLSAIEQILKAKVHPAIQVVADLSTLTFHQEQHPV
ncbi:MAG: NifU family protein [Chlamydiales bacterium]|nr:NifU family protein [Chlamydiales bacterium]